MEELAVSVFDTEHTLELKYATQACQQPRRREISAELTWTKGAESKCEEVGMEAGQELTRIASLYVPAPRQKLAARMNEHSEPCWNQMSAKDPEAAKGLQ